MFRSLAVLSIFACATAVRAEAPRFQFHKGEVLAYHLVQATKINETVLDEKTNKPIESEVITKIDLVRKWKVVDVDEKGVGTIELTIASMRWERKAGKDEDVFDSSKPDDLNKKEMAKNIGPVLAVLRIDAQGKLIEVKESKVGPATRFAADLPFKIVLPDAAPKTGDTWERSYTIQLDPPLGTGEKYAAVQKYIRQDAKSGLLACGLSSEVKDLPMQASDQIPLLPLLPEGTLYFQVETGRYYAARLKVQKELKNHQGEGSVYKFASTYAEDLIQDK